MMDLLASVGHQTAQEVMLAILERDAYQENEILRLHLTQRLRGVLQPLTPTVDHVLEEFSNVAPDGEGERILVFTLGTMASHLMKAGLGDQADRIESILREELRVADTPERKSHLPLVLATPQIKQIPRSYFVIIRMTPPWFVLALRKHFAICKSWES